MPLPPRQQIEPAPISEWRCVCAIAPRFGLYASTGGLYIRVGGRHGKFLHHVIDLYSASARAHCGACHQWRELHLERETGVISDRAYTGPTPAIDCTCTTVATRAAANGGAAGHAERAAALAGRRAPLRFRP
jgi:hypothetical protein